MSTSKLGRLLIVDDEEKVRKSLSGLLQDNGYEVVTAKNGPECLQTMSSQDFDLVILDIVMPGMSGIEVLQGIKERYKDTEVIMITGYADKEKAIATFRLNAYDFIEKPFESSEILNTIAHCLSQLSLRKDIEKKSHELRESEKKYRQLFETLQEGIWVIDKDAYTTLVNPRMTEMLGYTESEMLGKHLFSFMDEHGVEIAKSYLERRQQGIKEQHDFEFIKKDGSSIYTSLETAPITDKKGNYMGAIVAVQDITERKQAEEALKDSEERYRTVVENALIGVYRTNLKGDILYANEALSKMYEFESPEEMMSFGVLPRYKNPKDREVLIENLKKRGKVDNFEIDVFTKTGKTKSILMNATLDGDVIAGMALDITKRKLAEDAMERLRHQNELILNSAGEGILGLDLYGNHTFINPAAAKMLGYEIEELIGKHSHTIWHYSRADGSPYPEEECPIYAAYRDGTVHIVDDEVFWRKDVTSFPVRYTSTPIIEDDKIVGAVVNFRDITEYKQSEGALYKSEKELKNRVKELEDFYSMAVGRELKMIELKKEIEDLKEELKKYRKQ